MTDLNLDVIRDQWLRVCGACDAGIGSCSHPQEDYRPTILALVDEVARLAGEVDEYQRDLGDHCVHTGSQCDCPNAPDPVQAYHAMREHRDALRATVDQLWADQRALQNLMWQEHEIPSDSPWLNQPKGGPPATPGAALTMWVAGLLARANDTLDAIDRARSIVATFDGVAGWTGNGVHSALAQVVREHSAKPCCDLHGRNCEPPSELCCRWCTEAAHPYHRDGTVCAAPDLSGTAVKASPTGATDD